MSQSPKGSQQAVALIKFFSKVEHYLSFKDGCSMFRTPHYYRLEESAGRGDRAESCLGYWDKSLGDNMPTLVNNGREIDIKDATSLLIYPAHEQQDSWLQSWCVVGPHNGFEQSLERMLKEFGSYFVVLPVNNISLYAKLLSQASGSKVRYGMVRYSDNPLNRSLTVKDSVFHYQKEFRFYLGECGKGEIQDRKIQIQGVGNILLEAQSLKLASPSGKIRYCSLGRSEVVTARITT